MPPSRSLNSRGNSSFIFVPTRLADFFFLYPALLSLFRGGRDQCLGKIEVPLSSVKGAADPKDMVQALAPAEGSTERASGDLRVTVQLK